jgi:hypothetical protein
VKEECAVADREVTVQRAKENGAETMARLEANPCRHMVVSRLMTGETIIILAEEIFSEGSDRFSRWTK